MRNTIGSTRYIIKGIIQFLNAYSMQKLQAIKNWMVGWPRKEAKVVDSECVCSSNVLILECIHSRCLWYILPLIDESICVLVPSKARNMPVAWIMYMYARSNNLCTVHAQ